MKTVSPRALRIGVIHRGRLVDERVITERTRLTVSQAAGNTLMGATADAPDHRVLFDVEAGQYVLCLTAGMTARLTADGADVEVTGETQRIPLADTTQGRVQMGGVTLLFQLTRPPKPSPAPRLRRGLLGGAEPLFAELIAASLLLHLGGAAWLSTVPSPPPPSFETMGEAVVRWAPRFPPLPAVHRPPPVRSMETPRNDAAVNRPRRTAPDKVSPAEMGLLRLLGARGTGGAAAALLIATGPNARLGELLSEAHGVGPDASGPSTGPREARSSQATTVALPGVRAPAASAAPMGLRAAVDVQAAVRLEPVTDVVGRLDPKAIARTLRSRLAGFKACYERALKTAPDLRGRVTVGFTINEEGRVSAAEVESDTVGDGDVARCIVATLRRIRFPRPEEGSVSATFPFVLVHADAEAR